LVNTKKESYDDKNIEIYDVGCCAGYGRDLLQ
jgi:hypothetical protein